MNEGAKMFAVTCRTVSCRNDGWTLILNSVGHSVQCGGCGLLVGDVQPALEFVPPSEVPVVPVEPEPVEDPVGEVEVPEDPEEPEPEPDPEPEDPEPTEDPEEIPADGGDSSFGEEE